MALLVLDFDGVICDSVEECFVSSWTAYHGLHRGAPRSEAPDQARASFRAMRPFVRSGEDFVLIQELIATGSAVSSQAEFDGAWGRAGVPPRRYSRIFSTRRGRNCWPRDRQTWLVVEQDLPARCKCDLPSSPRRAPVHPVHQEAPIRAGDARANGLDIPEDHVLYSQGSRSFPGGKNTDLPAVSRGDPCRRPDRCHQGQPNPRIQVFLASWGYVQESWLQEGAAGVPVLAPDGFTDLLAGFRAGV